MEADDTLLAEADRRHGRASVDAGLRRWAEHFLYGERPALRALSEAELGDLEESLIEGLVLLLADERVDVPPDRLVRLFFSMNRALRRGVARGRGLEGRSQRGPVVNAELAALVRQEKATRRIGWQRAAERVLATHELEWEGLGEQGRKNVVESLLRYERRTRPK